MPEGEDSRNFSTRAVGVAVAGLRRVHAGPVDGVVWGTLMGTLEERNVREGAVRVGRVAVGCATRGAGAPGGQDSLSFCIPEGEDSRNFSARAVCVAEAGLRRAHAGTVDGVVWGTLTGPLDERSVREGDVRVGRIAVVMVVVM